MHPDYGVHVFQINDVLGFAARHSVKSAAEQFRLHISTIYRWRSIMRRA
jgi:transposase